MKVSLNTIKQLTSLELADVGELVARINAQLGGVEEVIDLGAKYKDAKIVKVVECDKHANADKLSVCKIDDGAGAGELIQVVCGANNVKAGMWAVWLPPESIVPSTFDDDEPFVLGARELRGEMSNGMLASARELGIGDNHDGIIELTVNDLPKGKELTPGANFADVFELDDTIIDIENKMFTHRPDLFGQLGVAREISGIYGEVFDDPKWYYEINEHQANQSFELKGFNEAGVAVPRLMLTGLDNISIAPSPMWLQAKLVALGSKPINNVVDVTNYVMLMTAQPLHAYDYDKLRGGAVGARMANQGEKVRLLNDKTYELTEEDIVIADGEGVIGLAGVMGGGDSEVSEDTTRVVLECATFDMYTIRKTSMRHGLFTDAVTRFNKGQSMFMNPYVMQYALQLLKDLSGASVVTDAYDDIYTEGKEWRAKPPVIPMTEPRVIANQFINERLGLKLSTQEIIEILTRVGFECKKTNDNELSYWSPAWRMDIQDPEDVVEEVGRLYGFDKLPRELPKRSIHPAPRNQSRAVKQLIRQSLSRAGANEVLTYSFVHENLMKKAEQDVTQAFQLSNALSPDLQYYRLSVLPSLLDKVHMNIKAGHDEFVLFEIGKAHNKKYHADDDDGLPREIQMVDAVYASKHSVDSSAFYYVRSLVESLANNLGFSLVFKPVDGALDYPLTAPFDLNRSALVESDTGVFIGMIGELKSSVIRNFKLPNQVAAMSLDFEAIERMATEPTRLYQPISKYPSVTQDVSLMVKNDVNYLDISSAFTAALKNEVASDIRTTVSPVSVYQDDDMGHKTITLRAKFMPDTKTLETDQVTLVMDRVVESISFSHDVKRV